MVTKSIINLYQKIIMKKRIIKRLEEIKEKENGFKKGTMRWDRFHVDTENKSHISEIDFKEVADDVLLILFERIIRRYYTQM